MNLPAIPERTHLIEELQAWGLKRAKRCAKRIGGVGRR
jgi:hypothetical protein